MERAVYSLAKHLRAQGVDVTLFTRPGKNAEAFPGHVVTVKYQRFHLGPHGRVLDRTFNYPTFSLLMGREVASRVRANEIDIVDAQGLTAHVSVTDETDYAASFVVVEHNPVDKP